MNVTDGSRPYRLLDKKLTLLKAGRVDFLPEAIIGKTAYYLRQRVDTFILCSAPLE